MDPAAIWFLGTAVALLPTGHALMRDVGGAWWTHSMGWKGSKPDASDWTFAALIVPLLCLLVWPACLTYSVVSHFMALPRYKRLKAAHREHTHKEAFKNLKEARACLLEQKRTEHRASIAQWTAEFDAADTRRIEAVRASRLAYEQAMAERLKARIAEERMYSVSRGYESIYCRHGNSLDFPCSHC